MRRHTSAFRAFSVAVSFMVGLLNMSATSQAAELDHYRQLLSGEFAASADYVSFPVVFAPNSGGLIFLNRKTGEQKIIYAESTEFSSPYLSKDKRLLFVQRKLPGQERELISCNVSNWRCESVFKTNAATIAYAIELSADTYLYASSPIRTVQGRKRASQHNFFFLKKGAAPIQLTNLDAYELGPFSIAGDRLLFSAAHGISDKMFAPAFKVAGPNSDIFSVTLAEHGRRIVLPELPLKALFLIGEYSGLASIAEDGEHIAFISRRNESGKTHFNLVVGDKSEKIISYIKAQEYGFSMPVFVGQSIVANELLPDRYEVKEYALSGELTRILFRIDYSVESLKKLPHIMLALNKRDRAMRKESKWQYCLPRSGDPPSLPSHSAAGFS